MRELGKTIQDARARRPELVTSLRAPRCILNQKITASRRFAAQSYSMPRIKALAKALDGTTNDVVMAMCAGALRRYLSDLNALPDKPLVAGVPVSLHRDREKAEPGNAVTFMLATLATDLSDPVERFRVIKASMDYNKARFQNMDQTELLAYAVAMLVPGTAKMMGSWERMPINVVISHVPGPRVPMYWQGCELDGLYPVSLIMDGLALNITLVSRGDRVDFGLIACRRTLPSVQRLLDHLEESLVELEDALG
jgi:diacylglycerol O-acyltransferase